MSDTRHGFEVVFLLGGTFRRVIDDLHKTLAAEGHPEARPIHGFALQAIGPHGSTISEMGRRLGVSKQAAAKTAQILERAGYLTREAGLDDARAVLLKRTARADALLALSARFFDRQMGEWRNKVGEDRFDSMVDALAVISEGSSLGDLPGWLTH